MGEGGGGGDVRLVWTRMAHMKARLWGCDIVWGNEAASRIHISALRGFSTNTERGRTNMSAITSTSLCTNTSVAT